MKNILLLTLMVLPFLSHAQNFTEADIPAVKDIQASILNLMVKAAVDYAGMRGAEVLKEETVVIYNATPEPAMHASAYYITYVEKNKKNYYMSYYTQPHDMLLITTAVNTMYAYAGNKWQIKTDPAAADGVVNTYLFCAGVKVGLLRQDTKGANVSFSVGFFSDPGSVDADAPTQINTVEKTTATGKDFKLLNVLKVFSDRPKNNLDFSYQSTATLPAAKSGSIDINTNSAEIIIQTGSESPVTYKIITVKDETTDKWGNKKTEIACTDASGLPCTAAIEKKYAYTGDNEMIFTISYTSGFVKGYICTYIENLFKN